MRSLKILTLFCCLGLLVPVLAPNAAADEWDKKTIVTFSGPVEVAGTKLDAGTYVFKLMDSQSDRHIVQIFNQDQSHIIATILAIPDYRLTPTSKTVMKFTETEGTTTNSGSLPAEGLPMKEWFYPGDGFGQAFRVLPQPAVTTETAEALPPAPPPVAEPEPQPEATPEPQPGPSAQETAPAEPAPEPQPQAQEPAPAATPAPLPKTASSMPLVGLLSLLALGAAASLGLIVKRMG
jgi:outer membrane biosynthesis protein TonB